MPVYDYVIVTEPLSTEQWDAIGWAGRQGIGDMGNQFHYYRPTDDGRILFGGYDAIHQSRMSHKHDSRPESFALLAEHLIEVFPVLDGIRVDARVGRRDRHVLALLGVLRHGQGRPGRVRRRLHRPRRRRDPLRRRRHARPARRQATPSAPAPRWCARMPVPFPPEPVRSAAIGLTTWSLDRADRSHGRRNLWLRTLDRLGLGFDS